MVHKKSDRKWRIVKVEPGFVDGSVGFRVECTLSDGSWHHYTSWHTLEEAKQAIADEKRMENPTEEIVYTDDE